MKVASLLRYVHAPRASHPPTAQSFPIEASIVPKAPPALRQIGGRHPRRTTTRLQIQRPGLDTSVGVSDALDATTDKRLLTRCCRTGTPAGWRPTCLRWILRSEIDGGWGSSERYLSGRVVTRTGRVWTQTLPPRIRRSLFWASGQPSWLAPIRQ